MGMLRSRLGSIAESGAIGVVEALFRDGWSGALRLRRARQIGNVWMIGGDIVHALWMEGKNKVEGVRAFEKLMTWSEGTYLLDEGALPPERSVREDTGMLLQRMISSEARAIGETAARASAASRIDLEALLSNLRERVPGIESLSVSSGDALAATTEHDTKTREWLHQQWKAFRDESGDQTETLLLRQGNRTLLVVKSGSLAAILSAQPHTTPEALLWAGADAGRRIQSLEYSENLVKST